MGWVDPWVDSWFESGWIEIFQFLVGWVHYSKSTESRNDYVNALQARLD